MTESNKTQPKPASVEEILVALKEEVGHDHNQETIALLTKAGQAITQQTESLAQAQAEINLWKSKHKCAVALLGEALQESTNEHEANNKLSAQLAALQYDGELPPLPAPDGFDLLSRKTAFHDRTLQDYARQAIANDRAIGFNRTQN